MDEPKVDEVAAFRQGVEFFLRHFMGREPGQATARELFNAVALAVRRHLAAGLLDTEQRYREAGAKRLYYLSMEFLMGRSLESNLQNLGLDGACRQALAALGGDLDAICEAERDAALGNGGLGRLAACFLDSLATLGLPGFGYGINYDYGLFRQAIDQGYQREEPDHWSNANSPWLIERPEEACLIPVYGRIEHAQDLEGNYNPMWLDWKVLVGVPRDLPVAGYGGRTVNYLRLFSAHAPEEFDIQIFNDGDYFRAVEQQVASENITKVLYPTDSIEVGRELRLVQEYFLVACAVRDIVRQYLRLNNGLAAFADQVAIQLNDTHPALAVAELMRLLVDEQHLSWEEAWAITERTVAYTNHTLLPEALEKWPVPLMERVLPRHLQLIYEINHRFLGQVEQVWPGQKDRQERMSVIEEGEPKQVRMAHLAIVGSHWVNGVAALHSELVKTALVPDFHQLWPAKFNNKTNGVTQRRWLLKANPLLADLLSETVGPEWIVDLERLRDLEPWAADAGFGERFARIKRQNKVRLAQVALASTRIAIDPDSLFDVQIKRIHEYKRQLLNALRIMHEYLDLVEQGRQPAAPQTFIFAGKAAPGYHVAKLIIKLINNLAKVINADPRAKEWLRVVFLPDYRVSLAERIFPAADLSEQISTAGKEASGTGNMKFMLNGALTIGTLDGANVEIRDEVGEENIFIFGLRAEEVEALTRKAAYHPWEYYHGHPAVRRVIGALNSDLFCPGEPGLFCELADRIMRHDEYFLLADLDSYLAAHRRAEQEFCSPELWIRKAVLNVARSGKFSSDRTISQYAREIWGIQPIPEG